MDRLFARRIAAIALLIAGLALIPLPGPGWPLVFVSLALFGWRPPGLDRALALVPQRVSELVRPYLER